MSETQERFDASPGRPREEEEGAGGIDSARPPAARWIVGAISFGLIGYLGWSGGGFDPIVYGRVGIAVWWTLLLGAAAASLSLAGFRREAMWVVVALAGLTLWTALSMIWSESADRSAQEAARASTYLAILVGALLLRRHGGLRPVLAGAALALGGITVLALIQRMQPDFADNETIEFVFAARARLNFPVNSWNGLASLLAMAAPLALLFAVRAPNRWARALSSAGLPLVGLALYLTISRGGALAMAAGLVALVVLFPTRSALLRPLAIGGLGAIGLIAAAEARPAFTDGLTDAAGFAQGDQMMVIAVAVVAVAAGASLLVELASARLELPHPPRITGRRRVVLVGLAVVLLVGGGFAAGAPGAVSDRWEEFKDPRVERGGERLASASGNGRYQWWDAAIEANASAPVVGIGAGTFQFWWNREATFASQVVDAHSLYLESLGELGIVGLMLVVTLIGGALVGVALLMRGASPGHRAALAATFAAMVAFAVGAASDWSWELPVVPAAFLVIAGAALGGGGREPGRGGRRGGEVASPATDGGRERTGGHRGAGGPFALGALALVGIAIIVPPLVGADSIRASQERAGDADLEAALEAADTADRFEPYSAPAALQRAFIYQEMGKLKRAAREAREATREEATNWENFFVLAGIEARRGKRDRAAEALGRARELYPFSAYLRGLSVGELRLASADSP